MPLPFILAGAAVAAAGFGAKKAYDGYQTKSEADEIVKESKARYEKAESNFKEADKSLNKNLNSLGELQLNVGTDFATFRKLAEDLLKKLGQSTIEDLKVNVPEHKLNKIKSLEFSTTAYLAKLAGGGVAGGAAAYAVYGGVMALAAASTGTPISALSGVAAYNATMAAIGGGSLAAGGFGMAGGTVVLGSVVAAPILAIAGWAYNSHAENALANAKKIHLQVEDAVSKLTKARNAIFQSEIYVKKITIETHRLYDVFKEYLSDLQIIDMQLRHGKDPKSFEDSIILVVQNGYALAAILTDIITTPLFKLKMDGDTLALDEDGLAMMELDKDGLQVLNTKAINDALETSKLKYPETQSKPETQQD